MSDQQILETEHFLPMEKLLGADPVPGQKGCEWGGQLPSIRQHCERLVADAGLWGQFAPRCVRLEHVRAVPEGIGSNPLPRRVLEWQEISQAGVSG